GGRNAGRRRPRARRGVCLGARSLQRRGVGEPDHRRHRDQRLQPAEHRFQAGGRRLPAGNVQSAEDGTGGDMSNVSEAQGFGLPFARHMRRQVRVSDLVIVGAGPAGLAAAVYGGSEGLDVLLLEANSPKDSLFSPDRAHLDPSNSSSNWWNASSPMSAFASNP